MGGQLVTDVVFDIVFERVVGYDIVFEDDKRLDDFGAHRIRFPDHRRHGHGWVPD